MNLTISLKLKIFLDRGDRENYFILDMNSFTPTSPLSIPVNDRKVILSVEWYF